MGTWYGPSGQARGDARLPGQDDLGIQRETHPGTKPCPNGVLLTNPNTPFEGTKMMDSMGRMWGCPGTMTQGQTEPGTTTTPPATTTTTPGATDTTSGLWSISPELQTLYGGLLGRAGDILARPLGYDPQSLAYMFGPGFETARAQEAATRNTLEGGLSRMGMLDTGAGAGMLNQNAWNTAGNISNLMRDIYVKGKEKEGEDLLRNTQLAQSLFGTGMGTEQLTEVLNAARRAEAQQFWNSLLSYFQLTKGNA